MRTSVLCAAAMRMATAAVSDNTGSCPPTYGPMHATIAAIRTMTRRAFGKASVSASPRGTSGRYRRPESLSCPYGTVRTESQVRRAF